MLCTSYFSVCLSLQTACVRFHHLLVCYHGHCTSGLILDYVLFSCQQSMTNIATPVIPLIGFGSPESGEQHLTRDGKEKTSDNWEWWTGELRANYEAVDNKEHRSGLEVGTGWRFVCLVFKYANHCVLIVLERLIEFHIEIFQQLNTVQSARLTNHHPATTLEHSSLYVRCYHGNLKMNIISAAISWFLAVTCLSQYYHIWSEPLATCDLH